MQHFDVLKDELTKQIQDAKEAGKDGEVKETEAKQELAALKNERVRLEVKVKQQEHEITNYKEEKELSQSGLEVIKLRELAAKHLEGLQKASEERDKLRDLIEKMKKRKRKSRVVSRGTRPY